MSARNPTVVVDRRKDNDHDVLIELRTEMRAARDDIRDIKDNTSAQITALQIDKAGKDELKTSAADLQKQVDQVKSFQTWLTYLIIGAVVAGVLKLIIK